MATCRRFQSPHTSHNCVRTRVLACVPVTSYILSRSKSQYAEKHFLTRYTKITGSNRSYISKYLEQCTVDKFNVRKHGVKASSTLESLTYAILHTRESTHCTFRVLRCNRVTSEFLEILLLQSSRLSSSEVLLGAYRFHGASGLSEESKKTCEESRKAFEESRKL